MFDKQLFVIRLESHHKNQVINLIKERQLSWTISDEMLSPSRFPVLFGVFKNQKLLSTMGLWKWKGLPYVTLSFEIIKPGFAFFNGLTNGHVLLFEKAIEYGSENGIFVFYASRKRKSLKAMLKYGKFSVKNYFSYTEVVVPKNTRPKEEAYWDMMDYETKPFAIEIKRMILKPEALDTLYLPKK